MQNNINSVQWESLEHAYGTATNIPELLIKIEHNDVHAVISLQNAIAHQGWASPQVSFAVLPFLFELTSSTRGNTKAKLIGLLSNLACAGDHEHFMGQRMQGSVFQELIANNKELSILRENIVSNITIIIDCLSDTEESVRIAAAQFIAVSSQKQYKNLLIQQIEKEKNKVTKADMLIALGWLIYSNEDPDIKLLESYLQDKDEIVEQGATIGIAYSASITGLLLDNIYWVLNSNQLKKSVWCYGHLYHAMAYIFIERARQSNDFTILLNAFSHIQGMSQSIIFRDLIKNNFKCEMESTAKPPKLEQLSDLQKSILKLVVDYQLLGSSVEYILKELGISPSPPGVSLYLGIPLPIEIIDSHVISFNGITASIRDIINQHCIASKPKGVNEDQVKLLAEAIAEETEIHQFMDTAFSISKIFKPEIHLLLLYFLSAKGNAIEKELSIKIDKLLEKGGTQFYYYASPYKKGRFLCGGDQFLLILYWTVLHHINPDYPVPMKVTKYPIEAEQRSLKHAYQFYGPRIYAGYKVSVWFPEAYQACKSVWPDITVSTYDLKEYGWDENVFTQTDLRDHI